MVIAPQAELGQSISAGKTLLYSVTYNGNTNTGGSVPTDSTLYEEADTATILGNTGSLTKTNYVFDSWNTLANGTGTSYDPDDTLTIGITGVTLYAQYVWQPPQIANLVGAWVSGLSGAISALGTWEGQYGTTPDVTLVGAATVGSDGLTVGATTGYGNLPNGTLIHDPMTIAFWMTWPGLTSDARIPFSAGAGAAGGAFLINIDYTRTAPWANNGWLSAPITPAWNSSDLWVIRLNGTALSISKNNGASTASWTLATPIVWGNTFSRLAAHSGGDPAMKASMDNVYIWDSILTADEEASLWNYDPYRQGNL
ncbi:MAG: hypothetical protein A2541_00850 [Candidatus Taylorbacteria bacterium RIFOXYD2_FULL_36_9]|uniref:Bacterial repeat domain-containing protein n=1 Tax=Candidatus Taylorbacteria bacterium RIFOXYD2_FULL_36_9 TaxID=1802338 RepID=A0A1G2PGH6_9BACT|nr:MAG: hypothetical protein A2541_00850 [Candidatus Taylorbacteria bacterium RIFOXYD2_FULL_36_9]